MTNALTNKVISRVREDLAATYGAAFSDDAFASLLKQHLAEATITDFVPVLVEAEYNNLMSTGHARHYSAAA